MKFKINQEKFYLKYAFFYTFIIAAILFFPFAVYINYSLKIQEAKTLALMKDKAVQIIQKMNKYDQDKSDTFIFPRFKQFQAGLYDKNSNAIFSLIKEKIVPQKEGYVEEKNKRFYILEFDNNNYFNSKYLVISTTFNYNEIFMDILIIFTSIMIIIFILSQIILRSFAKPFNEINSSLDNFIKDSMHEINTPLSIININIDMFIEKNGKDKYLARIKSASKILSRIYNDMNYLIKEQTINQSKKEKIDFSNFLLKSIDYFEDVAVLKGLKLKTEIEKDIMIDFVPTKLQKIIDNNLSNAIKYSKEEAYVIIGLHKKGKKIELVFQDFGIGMNNPENIFSRYYREDETKGGFGIGLSLVKKIMDDEGIKVKIESKLNIGSLFTYSFKQKS